MTPGHARADFRAVLLLLAALLGGFVVIEVTGDPAGGAVEQIGGRPQQVVEVGLEAGVLLRSRSG